MWTSDKGADTAPPQKKKKMGLTTLLPFRLTIETSEEAQEFKNFFLNITVLIKIHDNLDRKIDIIYLMITIKGHMF